MTDDNQHHSQSRSLDVDLTEAVARYETVSAERLNEWPIELLRYVTACICDLGVADGMLVGSRRRGDAVIGVDPDSAMRKGSDRWRPDRNFRLLADRLLDLSATFRTALSWSQGRHHPVLHRESTNRQDS